MGKRCLDDDSLHDTKLLADTLIANVLSKEVLPKPFTLLMIVIKLPSKSQYERMPFVKSLVLLQSLEMVII